ncbi:hypothetical protein Kpho02_66130 [Kitasatospora phosalacinea]|uniref:Uncharacterized protein n=1 Tax=Kitasatospora phosalacinea TaxID=2065 RepID=A0A9W6V6M1_9ACTN|nr:hypothetical protein [Kitasatospora phosalacinea]GLW74315.1 hypothetical protein Kpho02_66130 [Kitasatospora phosalacinea]
MTDLDENRLPRTTAFLAALDAVAWEGLGTAHPGRPVRDVPQALRRIACAGPGSTEADCAALFEHLQPPPGRPAPPVAAAALPFVVALAADPRIGARAELASLLASSDLSTLNGTDLARARALRTDPDPAVRRATLPPGASPAELLDRLRTEPDPAVRLPTLFALADAATATAPNARLAALLAPLLGGDDPVLWAAAVYVAAALDRDLAVRQLDRLVAVFADPALRDRFAEVWYRPHHALPADREAAFRWIHRRLAHDPAARLALPLRLLAATDPFQDAPLRREALDVLWRELLQRRSTASTLLPVAGTLLDDPDGPVRLRAAHLLAALGPAAAPYTDRLAALLDDTADDPELGGTVGGFARWALVRTGDPRALPGLVEQLRAQEEDGRRSSFRPSIPHVLVPLRAQAPALLPAIRAALRDGGPDGGATRPLLTVLRCWGEDALPALPELLPLLADPRTGSDALAVLKAIGPAAAPALPALATCRAHHPLLVSRAAARIGPDRDAELRSVVDEIRAAPPSSPGPFAELTRFGRAAAPYADLVRPFCGSGTEPWTRLTATITLGLITGEDAPAVRALEGFVLSAADSPGFGTLTRALGGLVAIGAITPAIRSALCSLQRSEQRLSPHEDHRAVLQDEDLRALIDRALACPDHHAAPLPAG